MIHVLRNDLRETSTLFILLKGTETRFNAGFQKTMKLMDAMFGETFWNNVVIGKVIIYKSLFLLVPQRYYTYKMLLMTPFSVSTLPGY